MEDRLTVIVPVYNVEKYLVECVESIEAQTYNNILIILVDDGSTDSSSILCDDLKKKYNNIEVIHQQNGGLPEARNTGLRHAKGKYVSFVDSDDIIDKEMYYSLISNLERNNAQISICNKTTFNRNGIIGVADSYKEEIIEKNDVLRFYQCALDSCCNRVFLLDSISQNNIWFESKDAVAQEDYYFQIKYFTFINKAVTTNQSYYLYRQRKSSITRSTDNYIGYLEKCLRFLSLTNDFVERHSDRKIQVFLQAQLLIMMFSSIGNIQGVTYGKVLDTIAFYQKDNLFKAAISEGVENIVYPKDGIRNRYFNFMVKLLRLNLYRIVAFSENIRTRRLHRSSSSDAYYE